MGTSSSSTLSSTSPPTGSSSTSARSSARSPPNGHNGDARKSFSHLEDGTVEEGATPEFLLSASADFREGKDYYASGDIDLARIKFCQVINKLAENEAKYQHLHEPLIHSTQRILDFTKEHCQSSAASKRFLTKIVRSHSVDLDHESQLEDKDTAGSLREHGLDSDDALHIDKAPTSPIPAVTEGPPPPVVARPRQLSLSPVATNTSSQACSTTKYLLEVHQLFEDGVLSKDEVKSFRMANIRGIIDALLADALMWTAVCCEIFRDLDDAEMLLQGSLDLKLVLYGEDSAKYAASLLYCAVLSDLRGNSTESRNLLEGALSICEQAVRKESKEFAMLLHNLGLCYTYLHQEDAARQYFDEAKSILANLAANPQSSANTSLDSPEETCVLSQA